MKPDTTNVGFRTAPGEGQIIGKSGLRLKVSSAQSGGALEVIELAGPGSPMPHIHHDHEECFYVIEGLFTFTLDGQEVKAPADSVVYVPRGTPHSFTHSEGARALVFVLPANLEGFFREMGEGMAAGRSEPEIRAALAGKYDSWPVG